MDSIQRSSVGAAGLCGTVSSWLLSRPRALAPVHKDVRVPGPACLSATLSWCLQLGQAGHQSGRAQHRCLHLQEACQALYQSGCLLCCPVQWQFHETLSLALGTGSSRSMVIQGPGAQAPPILSQGPWGMEYLVPGLATVCPSAKLLMLPFGNKTGCSGYQKAPTNPKRILWESWKTFPSVLQTPLICL